MKPLVFLFTALFTCTALVAHDLSSQETVHSHTKPPASGSSSAANTSPAQAAPFALFAPAVETRSDERFLYIESNGLPAHDMMIGITAWQQQVPLPQDYTGANAWRLPLVPVPAKEPASIRGRFLRGAIAIAANGIPIFNPQNNRGEISLDIGELDAWGGHCGRADDYHYHVAPLHLQNTLGPALPIACALDGYPIYGLAEPDGSAPAGLDALRGHSTPALGYHYHASEKYPFVIGGFHGEVTEREGQVDPQPRTFAVRESLQALRGAKITSFEKHNDSGFKLTYVVNGETRSVDCTLLADGRYRFDYDQGSTGRKTEFYASHPGGGENGKPPRDRREPVSSVDARPELPRSSNGSFLLSSPVVEDNSELPGEFTGDGAGISPPLSWSNPPAGTASYALLMDHIDPKGGFKWYWTVYDIPATTSSFEKGSQTVGRLGTGFRGKLGYEPPHSKGPGLKTYVITLYALSAPPALVNPQKVDRQTLLAAIKGKVLAHSSLRVVHTNAAGGNGAQPPTPRR